MFYLAIHSARFYYSSHGVRRRTSYTVALRHELTEHVTLKLNRRRSLMVTLSFSLSPSLFSLSSYLSQTPFSFSLSLPPFFSFLSLSFIRLSVHLSLSLSLSLMCMGSSMVRTFGHGAMGRRIDPSWWTY